MQAIINNTFGEPEVLQIGKAERPTINDDEILIAVKASAINRADTLQRMGKYPPPKGVSSIIGLEVAGVVEAIGKSVNKWKIGDRVCALLAGGGYAQYAKVHQDIAMSIPDNLDFLQASAIPEVFLTAYQALHWLGDMKRGETLLVHSAASGVGTAAIQMAKKNGLKVLGTASGGKHELCEKLGADYLVDYKKADFEEAIISHLGKENAVDIVIDFIAAPYFKKNINLLAPDGRYILLALMGGTRVNEFSMAPILRKRLQIKGSTLRARSLDYKGKLVAAFMDDYYDSLKDGSIRPIIDSIYDWQDVAAAHRYMEANKNQGKIVLKIV